MQFRVGTGFDVHALVENRSLILAGVQIPYEKGLLGHSDADVALHALMDALLGAVGMGDIGKHFPDTDARFEGADSRRLLRFVVEMLQKEGWQVNNVDVTIIAQRPKLAPFIATMRERVASEKMQSILKRRLRKNLVLPEGAKASPRKRWPVL